MAISQRQSCYSFYRPAKDRRLSLHSVDELKPRDRVCIVEHAWHAQFEACIVICVCTTSGCVYEKRSSECVAWKCDLHGALALYGIYSKVVAVVIRSEAARTRPSTVAIKWRRMDDVARCLGRRIRRLRPHTTRFRCHDDACWLLIQRLTAALQRLNGAPAMARCRGITVLLFDIRTGTLWYLAYEEGRCS